MRRAAPQTPPAPPLPETHSEAVRSPVEHVLAIWACASAADRQAIVEGLRAAIRTEITGHGTVASESRHGDVFSVDGRTSYAPPAVVSGVLDADAVVRDLKANLRAENKKAKEARSITRVAKTLVWETQSENSRLRDELDTARYELAQVQNRGKAAVVKLSPVPPPAASN